MRKKSIPDKIRRFALFLVLPIGAFGLLALNYEPMQEIVAYGPLQDGHSGLNCIQCHVEPTATWRQQIQANVRYALGVRAEPVDFGYLAVSSDTCIGCHERPNERHPVYRFREPRFQKLQMSVDATSCLGCHTEHSDERSFVTLDFCKSCHESLVLKNDPIDISHEVLIAQNQWGTCLGCHDFHGNHIHEVPTLVDAAISIEELRAYLRNGPSPYGADKIYEADQK